MSSTDCLDTAAIIAIQGSVIFSRVDLVFQVCRRRHVIVFLLTATLALQLGLARLAAQPTPAPDPLVGIWDGTYVCYQGETAVSVALAKPDATGATRGTFTFGSLPGQTNARAGSYNITGAYDRATQDFIAVPAGWIDQPENYVQVGFTAALGASGQTLTGRVDFQSCSTIVLHKRAVS